MSVHEVVARTRTATETGACRGQRARAHTYARIRYPGHCALLSTTTQSAAVVTATSLSSPDVSNLIVGVLRQCQRRCNHSRLIE